MRLLDMRTGHFRWIEDPRAVRYAILSHVWAKERDPNYVPEQTYQDVLAIQAAAARDNVPVLPRLSDKIRRFCEVAQADGFELGWADSCCIDKTSSAELSEAINSMYAWYRYAGMCYAFLRDVSANSARCWDEFRESEWFKRGWTLQELIAPDTLIFVSAEWIALGSKRGLPSLVREITRIDHAVLTSEQPTEKSSVASRMSWAAQRVTTREEDRAYSLMGLFGISMAVLYGEGGRAFMRLQEEILKTIPDQSIFAWGSILPSRSLPLPSHFLAPFASVSPNMDELSQYALATSPDGFEGSFGLTCLSRKDFVEILGVPWEDSYQTFTMTPHGVHGRFPLITISPLEPSTSFSPPLRAAVLPLATQETPKQLVVLLLTSRDKHSYVVGRDHCKSTFVTEYFRGMYIPEADLRQLVCTWGRLSCPKMTNVYIAQESSGTFGGYSRFYALIPPLVVGVAGVPAVTLSSWSEVVLRSRGYYCTHPGTASAHEDSSGNAAPPSMPLFLTISNRDRTEVVNIHLGRCNCSSRNDGRAPLAIRVSSPTAWNESQDFTPHSGSHPTHVDSWKSGNIAGIAATKVQLILPGPTSGPPTFQPASWKYLTLILTLTHLERVPEMLTMTEAMVWSTHGNCQLSVEIDAS